jgi:hypothetical protein
MTQPEQLGFGFDEMLREQETAHLPATMEEAIPYYRKLIERHHEAMLAGDEPKVMEIRNEARDLAIKLNGGELLGICGGPDAPAMVLERATAGAHRTQSKNRIAGRSAAEEYSLLQTEQGTSRTG